MSQIIEPKLNDAQCGFRPSRSSTDHISLSSKVLRNLVSMPKTPPHILSTSRKHTTRFLVKSFGGVLTVACYWASSHCIPAQKFTTVHRGCWTSTRVCAVTAPFHSLHQWFSTFLLKGSKSRHTTVLLISAARPTRHGLARLKKQRHLRIFIILE